jgi:uncharacterized protein YcfL
VSFLNNLKNIQMKKILFIAITALILTACGLSQSTKENKKATETVVTDDSDVLVYYFHGRMRCPTCINIQAAVKATIEENFVDNKEVKFVEIDFSQSENAAIAEKYEIAWSSVVIAKADEHTNLTDEAFALINTNPEELKRLVKEETKSYLDK